MTDKTEIVEQVLSSPKKFKRAMIALGAILTPATIIICYAIYRGELSKILAALFK